jgi:aminocarboxymuconate-semialdehyde decarboxylase
MLRYVIDSVGSNRVAIGSDYPFPLGDLSIGGLVDEMHLPPQDKANLYHASALDWLGLSQESFVPASQRGASHRSLGAS